MGPGTLSNDIWNCLGPLRNIVRVTRCPTYELCIIVGNVDLKICKVFFLLGIHISHEGRWNFIIMAVNLEYDKLSVTATSFLFFWCGMPHLAAFIFLLLFLASSGPYFHLVFRWSRDSNPHPRSMAQFFSSPLDSLSYCNIDNIYLVFRAW